MQAPPSPVAAFWERAADSGGDVSAQGATVKVKTPSVLCVSVDTACHVTL